MLILRFSGKFIYINYEFIIQNIRKKYAGAMADINPKPITTNEYAYEEIKQRILNGTFAQGEKLQTQAIADELKISRTPVVVAINRLASEGYATSVPQQGVFARKFNYRSIHDILELRRMIELYSTDAIIEHIRFDKTPIKCLWEYAGLYKELENGAPSYKRAMEIECLFHHAFIGLSENEEVLRVYKQSLCVEATYYMYRMANMPLSQVVVEYREHANLVELLESGDSEQLRTLLDKHIHTPLSMLDWLAKTGRLVD